MQDDEIQALKNRILNAALAGVPIEDIFRQICETISGPFDLARVNMGMPTLHPLVEAQSMWWTAAEGVETLHSEHGYSRRDDWLSSPISFMIEKSFQACVTGWISLATGCGSLC